MPPTQASIHDLGALGDGVTDDYPALQAALDSGARHVMIPGGTYTIGNVLRPKAGQCIELHGTLKIRDAVIQPLARDMGVGDRTVDVRDGTKYTVGQWVTLHDEQLPIQGGGHKTRRQNAGSARIARIDGNTLTLDTVSARTYRRAQNAVLATQHSALLIEHSDVRVCGTGTIDGNKAHQLDTAPGFLDQEASEDWRAASGIVVAGGPDRVHRVVIEGVTVRDTVLHGMAMRDASHSVIRNTICRGAHDKNITLWRCTDCRLLNNMASDSEWEDGIIFHQVHDPDLVCARILVQGNICSGNPRNGIHVGANHREIFLSGNLCTDNALNISIDGDDCSSANDVATGSNDRVFPLSAQRPSVLVAGRRVTVSNLTSLDSPSNALGLHGEDIAVRGGLLGNMRPQGDGIGVAVCSPTRYGTGRTGAAPRHITVSGTVVRGCRVGVLVDAAVRRVRLYDNDLRLNSTACDVATEAWPQLQLRDNAGLPEPGNRTARGE